MKRKPPKKPELPRARDFFPPMEPRWIKMEPPRLATLAALFFSTCVMLFYFVRQCMGISMEPGHIILSVAKTFLVAYAGTGFFVWYLLRVAERELPHPENSPPARRHLRDEESEEVSPWEEDVQSPEEPEEHS